MPYSSKRKLEVSGGKNRKERKKINARDVDFMRGARKVITSS